MGAMAIPNITPASLRTATGDFVSGGPMSTSSFSQASGAGRVAVRMTGIPAVASSGAA